jgi:hypothetical protein
MAKELFVFRTAINTTPEFYTFATIDTLFSLPAKPTEDAAFFRTSEVELVFTTADAASAFLINAGEALQRLALDWDIVSTYGSAATVTVTGSHVVYEIDSSPFSVTLISLPECAVEEDDGDQTTSDSQDNDLVAYLENLQSNYAETATEGHDVGSVVQGGWVPVAWAPHAWEVPEGAKWFYNIGAHLGRFSGAPPLLPSKIQMFANGTLLPPDVVYKVVDGRIYWMDFDATLVSGYPKVGNAPWATDYADLDSPGGGGMDMNIVIFT